MTLARELELVENQNGFRLRSKAPSGWEAYTSKVLEKESISAENETLLVEKGSVDLSAAQVSLNLVDLNNKKYTFQLENTMGEVLSFGIDQEKNQFFIDRSKSGETNFSETFSIKPSVAPRTAKSKALDIQFILDKMSLEVFYDKGETVMTEIFFSQAPFETLRLNTTGNSIKIEDLQILELSKN
jgi:levanase/fructan beta-fructosidase